jgi:hypothetical protein
VLVNKYLQLPLRHCGTSWPLIALRAVNLKEEEDEEKEEEKDVSQRQRASSEMNDISSCGPTLPLRDLIAQIQISTNRWNCC